MSYNLRTKNKVGSPKVAQFHNYASSSSSTSTLSQAEKSSFTPVTNINDLKKITPRVKVLNQETPTLQSLKKSNLDSSNFPPPRKSIRVESSRKLSQESSNSFSPSSRKSTNSPLTRKFGQEGKLNQKTIILSSPEKKEGDDDDDDDTEIIDEETKNKMRKYCRTCAEMKFPLVDIFSDKGIQMRLNLQIKHLQQIAESDSLTTQMCMDCICDLKMSFTFFVQIKKAEMKLRAIRARFVDDSSLPLGVNEKLSFGGEKETKSLESEGKIQSLIQHDVTNLKNNGPRISAVFSTNATEWEEKNSKKKPGVTKIGSMISSSGSLLPKDGKMERDSKVKIEPKGNQDESDNESIEEFDPEDTVFNPSDDEDLGEVGEENVLNPFKKSMEKIETGTSRQNSSNRPSKESCSKESSKDFANVSNDFANVSKDFPTLSKEGSSKSEEETPSRGEEEQQGLKRKCSETRSKGFDSKIRKFNVNDALSIKQEENGVMYVTVRGEKPNELLLVKVKKMEKAEKSRPGRKESENLFVDRSLEQKGQIIEHQIEQYKRRREKVLGPIATTEIIPECRIKTEQETLTNLPSNQTIQSSNQFSIQSSNQFLIQSSNQFLIQTDQPSNLSSNKASNVSSNTSSKVSSNISSNTSSNVSSNTPLNNSSNQTPLGGLPIESPVLKLKDISEIKKEKPQRCRDRKMPVDVKVYTNAEDYNNRIETVKSKLEDKQRKDWEEVNPGQESTMERLRRILEDKDDESVAEFMENLQQRKMIITKMSDEDLVNLYQERMAGKIYTTNTTITNTIEESDPLELNSDCFDLKSSETFDCDFCFSEFPTKDVCDEHMKFHDSKIQYLCEDCNEEFTILRYKKNHNVICIRKLICKYCDLMLDSKGKKKQHEQKHCDSLFGQLCEYCGEKFKHQGTLDQHVKSKHMTLEKIFQCPKCPKKFTFKTKLSFHLKSVHTAMRAYLCEDCGADFKNPASLRHHRIRKHLPTGNKRECPVCRKMIPFYSLSKHMHTHKAYTIKCPHCDKMFKNSSTLKQHVRIHEDQRQFRCDTCGVGFNRRDGLRLHMKVHEKADSRGLKECSCQVCGEKFPNHSMLVIHRNRIHKDGRNFTCHICNRSMISTRSLEWHLAHIHNEPLPGIVKAEMITGSDSKRVACFHCHKTFKTEMILRTHIKNSHMEKEPVKCLDCDDTFVSEVRLRHHMMVAHNRLEGTLACPHCPKRFVNQLRLKTHMIAHSEDRPFRCDICGFNLKTKIQLIKHHQNRHSDERPLQCRYCPWRCKQVSALVCHERTHTNERPYSCSVCRQRFKYLGDKNKHERRHESLGGSGFKRIVTNRGPKKVKTRKEDDDTSNSDQEQETLEEQMEEQMEEPMEDDEMETMEMEARLVDAAYEAEEHVKIEANILGTEDEHGDYPQDYEESSKDATEVIMNMEDTAVYTEEVTAENIESIETTQIIEDELMANQLLQSGTVVHIEQQDEEGKIQMIPVVLSLPDLTEENAEVNLATTSIMYNNEVEEEDEEEEEEV